MNKFNTEYIKGTATQNMNASMSRILHNEIRKLCFTSAKCVLNTEQSKISILEFQDFTWDCLLEDVAASALMLQYWP